MNIRCESFERMKCEIVSENKRLVLFGCGVIGRITAINILGDLDMLDHIDCFIDNDSSKWGERICHKNTEFLIKSVDYLNECGDNTVIMVNISRYFDVLRQLEAMECTDNMDCILMGMMCVYNFCSSESFGETVLTNIPVIPKKLHYMWLGGKPIPDTLKKCIDSWIKYCPDYEIIEWNEDNYDVSKHLYMKQAYENKAYGFVPDYARLDILYNEGGLYLDTDVEIKRNIDDLLYQEAFCGVEKWQVLNFGGMSGAVKGNRMIKAFLDLREQVMFVDKNGNHNQNTCGFYDTQVVLDEGYHMNGKTQCINGMNIYAYDYFHPYDYMSGIVNETKNTHSIHWFNGGWLDESMKKANEQAKKQYMELYQKAVAKQKLDN